MSLKSLYRAIAPLLLVVVLTLTACNTPSSMSSGGTSPVALNPTVPSLSTPTPATPTATEDVTTAPLADIADLPPQQGSAFNKFFPDIQGTNYERIFTQEKTGFAAIKLSLDGQEMAQLSISDTVTNLTARNKFIGVQDHLLDFPLITQGQNATAVLVGDRYQVKIMSRSDTFTETDRKEWLTKVDLEGLSSLK